MISLSSTYTQINCKLVDKLSTFCTLIHFVYSKYYLQKIYVLLSTANLLPFLLGEKHLHNIVIMMMLLSFLYTSIWPSNYNYCLREFLRGYFFMFVFFFVGSRLFLVWECFLKRMKRLLYNVLVNLLFILIVTGLGVGLYERPTSIEKQSDAVLIYFHQTLAEKIVREKLWKQSVLICIERSVD